MNILKLLENPITILIIILIIIHYCMETNHEKFSNDSTLQTATALIQSGVTLQQATKLGVSKQDYITATIIVANSR